jgi:murein DD-endopeptidase MepM/ murein hydrolase activator NlpD
MHEIDRSFRARKVEAEERRVRGLRRRIITGSLAAVLVAAAGVGGFFTRQYWLPQFEQIKQVALPQPPAPVPPKPIVVASTNVDLPGDPLIIRLGGSADANSKVHDLPVSDDLKQPALPDNVAILSDIMLSSSERIMALPSTPEDFAFFQSQSARARPPASVAPAPDAQGSADQNTDDTAADDPNADEVLVPVAGQDDAEGATNDQPVEPEAPIAEDGIPTDITGGQPQDEGGGIGGIGESDAEMAAGDIGDAVGQDQPAVVLNVKKTAIEDTTTVQAVTPEVERFRQVEDFTVSVKGERPLDAIITEYGFSADDAKAATDAAKQLMAGLESVGDRSIVGLRGHRQTKGSPLVLMQVSINTPAKYLGTVARADDGSFVSGADPWINEDLSQYANGENANEPQKSYRLLDAIYSTSTRNNVPSSVTGEAIMLISRSFDLQALATKSDRLILAYAKEGPDKDAAAGRVLYVAVRGVDRDFQCFVYQPQPDADYACMTEKDATHSFTVMSDMVTPVKGVLTSTFGPRLHPILNQVRIHKGVDWAAPIGTPVVAAFAGKIVFAGDGKGYGNVIRIDHGGGKATAYAHMGRFEQGIAVGVQVKAGDTIGYVGNTGLSTGPHLHFELYMNGAAIDPLGSAVAGAAGLAAEAMVGAEAPIAAGSDGTAVELLVNHIVHVESGGNARAKNPLSSAAGLGQFIKSTWLRMMRTYRPELFKSMSEDQILELRYDPTMARQMVGNLARENEARLRAYGHAITAGRLYLAHFLGPEGAHQALAAPGNAMIVDVMGAAVISANPFLTGKDCAFVVAWAEKKMSGRAPSYVSGAAGATSKTVVQTSPEFIAYKGAMLKLVELALGPAAMPNEATGGQGGGSGGDKGGAAVPSPAAATGTEEE